jgi:hypothetical protein
MVMNVAVALFLGGSWQDGDPAFADHAHQLPSAAREFILA